MKNVIENLEKVFHVFQILWNQACLKVEEVHFQNLLKHAVRYTMHSILCAEISAFKLSVCLGGFQLNSMY
jgi:hypothetical protein